MKLLELQGIRVRLEKQDVLQELSLQLDAGERLVLMGASGAGKTTLLRVIAGLQQPSSGTVLLNGKSLASSKPNDRRIALLSQDYALYPQLSVQRNITVALKQQGLSSAEIVERCEQVASWFGIESLRDRLPSQISGGQAQRVAFAKALARQPQLLLLDEPFSQVDCSLRHQLSEILLPACEQLRIAICWVTHDPQEAFQVATRIAVLADGNVVQDASAEEIYQSPASKLVAELTSVWPVNWLPLDRPEFTRLRDTSSANYVGVRPEHFLFLIGSGPVFELRVEQIRFIGFARLIQGTIGQTKVQVLDQEHRCRPGDQIKISLDPSKIMRFSE